MRRLLTVAILLVVLLLPPVAMAQEYARPTFQNITKALVRFNAINIMKDDYILDDYAIINECELYDRYYLNEFDWQKTRQIMRENLRKEVGTFPTGFYYTAQLQLGRYNFSDQRYDFSEKTTQRNVNTFVLDATEDSGCGKSEISSLPTVYRLVLDDAMYIPGLPLSEAEGRALLDDMKAKGNNDRIVYVRFGLRVVYIAPLSRSHDGQEVTTGMLSQASGSNNVKLDVRLDHINYYSDKEMKSLIYSYQP